MRKALQVASVASMIDQFTMLNIKVLQELGYKVDVATNFDFGSNTSNERVDEFKEELYEKNVEYSNILFNRKVFSKENIVAYKKLKKLIENNNYDLIHCHSPIGGVLTRLAARKVRKKGTKVIYTAHGFHFYKGASIKNWLVFFPVEWLCSLYTDVLITINEEDYALAKKMFFPKSNKFVPGVGVHFDVDNSKIDKKVNLREELNIKEDTKLLLSVGEINHNKNHELIIRSLKRIMEKDDDVVYVICGIGNYTEKLKKIVADLNLTENVFFLGYRDDVKEILHFADIFVFPSFREGLSVALIEAMSASKPILCSNIRGNSDLVSNGKEGYLFNPKSIESFVLSYEKLLSNHELDYYGSNSGNKAKKYEASMVELELNLIYDQKL